MIVLVINGEAWLEVLETAIDALYGQPEASPLGKLADQIYEAAIQARMNEVEGGWK